jgi:hypothetical protein
VSGLLPQSYTTTEDTTGIGYNAWTVLFAVYLSASLATSYRHLFAAGRANNLSL